MHKQLVPLWLVELAPLTPRLWWHLACHRLYCRSRAWQPHWMWRAAFRFPLALAPTELQLVAHLWGFEATATWWPILTNAGAPGPSLADDDAEMAARLQDGRGPAADRVVWIGDLLAAQRGDRPALRQRIVEDGEAAIQQRVRYNEE